MNIQIDRSPLDFRQRIYQMPIQEAQTMYPSLQGQCISRTTCHFTMADVKRNQNKEQSK